MELFVGIWVCGAVALAWRAASDRARYTWLGVAALPVACWLGYLLLVRAVDRQIHDEAVASSQPVAQRCDRVEVRQRWLISDDVLGRGFGAAGDCDDTLTMQSVDCEISRKVDTVYIGEATMRGFTRLQCRDPHGMHSYPLH